MKMEQERKILAHRAVPGYRLVFFIILAISVAYLALVFLQTL